MSASQKQLGGHWPSPLMREKTRLIDFACRELGLRSFADLGGVWGVEGGYTFYTLDRYEVERAFLVDSDVTPATRTRAREHPELTVVEGYLGDPSVRERVGRVDGVFLFDILLHQVAPDWDEILGAYSELARLVLVFNRQFRGARTVRLFDLGEEGYFANVPHHREEEPYKSAIERARDPHPRHGGTYRDVQDVWQWGITNADLIAAMASAGYRIARHDDHGPCPGLERIENHAFVFESARR